jgi:HEAT repeat protein
MRMPVTAPEWAFCGLGNPRAETESLRYVDIPAHFRYAGLVTDTLGGMGTGDVLAGLDEIDWAELEHAYGSADDVPGLIRVLASTEPDERERARRTLYGNIFHQGSRYEATAYAVPFLARLAADPRVPQRDGIVRMLALMAIGYDEAYLHASLNIAGWRAQVEQARAADPAQTLRWLDAWVEAARSEGERRRRERRMREIRRDLYDPEKELRAAQAELGAYDAVRAEVAGLRGLLEDGDPQVRAAASYLVGWFPEEAADSMTCLRALLSREIVPGVSANAIVSAGLLGDSGLEPRLREYLGGQEPLLRWASAIALARLGLADPDVLGALAAASEDPPQSGPGPSVHFLDGNLKGYAAQALAALDGHLPADVIDGVLHGLARSEQVAAFPMAVAALRLAFPGGVPDALPPFGELTELQQRVVRTLAELGPETWHWGNFRAILRNWGLPTRQADCRAYVGLDSAQ